MKYLYSIRNMRDTSDILDQLMADERTKDTILIKYSGPWEASKNLPESLIAAPPEVDWSGHEGIRGIVTSRYFRVDWHLLWNSVHEELPVLKIQVCNLMNDEQEWSGSKGGMIQEGSWPGKPGDSFFVNSIIPSAWHCNPVLHGMMLS